MMSRLRNSPTYLVPGPGPGLDWVCADTPSLSSSILYPRICEVAITARRQTPVTRLHCGHCTLGLCVDNNIMWRVMR